jgi:hypothetical protein
MAKSVKTKTTGPAKGAPGTVDKGGKIKGGQKGNRAL